MSAWAARLSSLGVIASEACDVSVTRFDVTVLGFSDVTESQISEVNESGMSDVTESGITDVIESGSSDVIKSDASRSATFESKPDAFVVVVCGVIGTSGAPG